MNLDVRDDLFMQRALALARSTTGLASPNPLVGCVLVREGLVLAEGAHLYEQRDHAEIVALKQAASRGLEVRGATAYVTLEPCSHQGRTGPCADALIAGQLSRVVVATIDPNPLVAGRGLATLKAAGIEVSLGVCRQSARDLIEAFAYFARQHLPFVTLKAALSVDGKLAPPPARRSPDQPYWLTGPTARAAVQQLRHGADAILTGIGTVLADDPALTDRTGLPRRRALLRIILDTHLRTPPECQLVRSAADDVLIVCGDKVSAERAAALEARGIEVLQVAEQSGRLDLGAILSLLAERQLLSVLLEAGSRLNGAFLAEGLVDKVVLFYAETELGVAALPFAEGIASPFLFEQTLTRTTRSSCGSDACMEGYLHDPWKDIPS